MMTNKELQSIYYGACFFRDNHCPDEPGTEVYGRNLVEEIRKIGF